MVKQRPKPPNAGKGRVKGVPNKATADVRACIALIAQRNIEAVENWLLEVDDPAKRVDLYLRMIEYHIPKLGRMEHQHEVAEATLAQLLAASRKVEA